MKRIHSFMAAAFTMIAAASCVQELGNDGQLQEGAVVYKAIAEGADTKAFLGTNEAGRPQSMWEDGDKIYIQTGNWNSYTFTTSLSEPSPVADFTYTGTGDFELPVGDAVIATHPYINFIMLEERYVTFDIPVSQKVGQDVESYDQAAVTVVAYSRNRTLNFKNTSALLKCKVGLSDVAKIRFYGLNGEAVAGSAIAVMKENGEIDNIGVLSGNEYSVELSDASGGALRSSWNYYISIIPNTFASGFGIELLNAAGEVVFTKEYDKSITIERNTILNLGTLGTGGQADSYDKLYVVGTYNGWSHDANLYLFDYAGEGTTYSGMVDFNAYARKDADVLNEFKFTGGSWGNNEFSQASGGSLGSEAAVISLVEGSGDNINVYQEYRFYHFTLDKSASTLTKNYAFNSIGVIGGFTLWNEDVDMNFNPDTQNFWVDLDLSEDTELKIRLDEDWGRSFGSENNSGVLDGGDNISVSAGQYRLYVNMNNPSRMTYTFDAQAYGTEENAGQWDPWADEPQPEPVSGWSLIGEFNSWNGDELMTETEPGLWVITGFALEAGQQWKLRKDGSWDENYGGPGSVEPYNITVGETFTATYYGMNMAVSTSGDYDIYFDKNKETILVLEAGSPLLDYVDEYGINHGPGVEIDGVVWAPVNCGYHETDYKWGKLYQWGRKYGQGYDCPWDKTYVDASVPNKVQGYMDLISGQSEVNADKFYYNDTGDWRIIAYDNLWNLGTESKPVKTEYDPCPKGWRVPTGGELNGLRNNSSSWTTVDDQDGYWFSGSTSYTPEVSQVFFSAAGYRRQDRGDGLERNRCGYYWSSQDSGFCFYSSYSSSVNDVAALGASVRCVQDETEFIPVSSFTIDRPSVTLLPGTSTTLNEVIIPSDANHKSASSWYSSDTSVATVDMNGTVMAVSEGTATITAFAGMKTAVSQVTVKYPDTDGTREVTLWEGETLIDNWSSDESSYILSDGGTELLAAGAQPGDMVCFYVEPFENGWQLDIWEGHWASLYLDVIGGVYDLDAAGGRVFLSLTQEMLNTAFTQYWWGGTFLLNGDNLRLTKVTLLTSSPDNSSSSDDYVDEYGINHGPGVEIDGVVWAPVNCGYHETDYKYGKLYQWGRKYGQGYITPYFQDAAGSVIEEGPVSLLEGQSEDNKDIFFSRLNGGTVPWRNLDWLDTSRSDLWNAGTEENPVKTEYDPCPEGWRVPTYMEVTSLGTASSVWLNGWEESYNGMAGNWISDPDDESVKSFFPAAGFFDEAGNGVNRQYVGEYWSSLISNGANCIVLDNDGFVLGSGARVSGNSVRCVKE